ncbi:pyridoxamine 5'-phosphate oxidase family protein [soil metagenome]
METQEHKDKVKDLKKKIDGIKIAMMTTEEPDGNLRSRPMATNEMDEDGTLWFFTREFDPKVNEVNQNHKINLSYSDPENNLYVSISGEAYSEKDKNKIEELWQPHLKAWFPQGKDDPKISLLKVNPTKVEYWDSESSNMVLIFNIAKSILKGEKHESKENIKISL